MLLSLTFDRNSTFLSKGVEEDLLGVGLAGLLVFLGVLLADGEDLAGCGRVTLNLARLDEAGVSGISRGVLPQELSCSMAADRGVVVPILEFSSLVNELGAPRILTEWGRIMSGLLPGLGVATTGLVQGTVSTELSFKAAS